MSGKIQKMLSATLYIILAVILITAVIVILPVYRKYVNMQNKVSRLEQEDRELYEEYQSMQKEVHDLEHQSLAVEKIAREKYNLCKENEQILIYK
ncbi:MAG: cell division protein FtsL [Lentisphaeria bacterium]|nr:cell division protein FtsL [Lentisphaeria bacterium]